MQSICFGLKVGWVGGCLGEGSIILLLNPFIFPYLPYIIEVLRSHTNHSVSVSWPYSQPCYPLAWQSEHLVLEVTVPSCGLL